MIPPRLKQASAHLRAATDLVRQQIPELQPLDDVAALADVLRMLIDTDGRLWRCHDATPETPGSTSPQS